MVRTTFAWRLSRLGRLVALAFIPLFLASCCCPLRCRSECNAAQACAAERPALAAPAKSANTAPVAIWAPVVPAPMIAAPRPRAAAPAEQCGFDACHGLEFSCSKDAPKICSKIYESGDLCRRYASCDTTDGKCELVLTAEFGACKACVENCRVRLGGGAGFMDCERACKQ